MGGKEIGRAANRQRLTRATAGLALLWAGADVLPAQPTPGPRPSLESPVVLSLPWSARGAALGGAYLAGDDADVLFTNPAALGQARGVTLGAMRTDDAMLGSSVAAVTTLGGWSVGIGARAIRLAARRGIAVPLRGEVGRVPDPAFRAWRDGGVDGSAAITMGVSRRVGPLRVGASLHAANEVGPVATRDDPLSTTLAGDVGALLPLGYGSLALVARAVGPDPRDAGVAGSGIDRRLPTRVLVGYGTPLLPVGGFIDLGAQIAVGVRADGAFEGRGGIEFGFAPVDGVSLLGRAGTSQMDGVLRATWGLGLVVDRVAVDVAYEPDPAAAGWRLGLRIR